jgi:hypothetical protein
MKKKVNPLFFVSYWEAVKGNRDIWWTPMSMALNLSETRNDFLLFLNGISLQEHLEKGSLQIKNSNGKLRTAVQNDVRVRLNNWEKTVITNLHMAVFRAFIFGIVLSCFLFGIWQFFRDKKVLAEETENLQTTGV